MRSFRLPVTLLRSHSKQFSATTRRSMKVIPVPVRSDNYAYLLVDETANTAAAVDPYDVPKVQAAAAKAGVEIVAGITTHHHHDHSGGNPEFAKTFPGVPIYGGSTKIPALTELVKDKDEFKVSSINIRCLHTPCHTQDSICYYATSSDASHSGGVFTGDTLFIAGCGRFFEGTAAEMHRALSYLSTLPDSTVVYNGHEYTPGNLAFAKSVDAGNPALNRLEKIIADSDDATTGLTTIGDEKEWNPFIRLNAPSIRQATGATSDVEAMGILRELKNSFRG